jgi:hypothetical protein
VIGGSQVYRDATLNASQLRSIKQTRLLWRSEPTDDIWIQETSSLPRLMTVLTWDEGRNCQKREIDCQDLVMTHQSHRARESHLWSNLGLAKVASKPEGGSLDLRKTTE